METTNKENRRKEREKNYIDMMSMVKNNFIKLNRLLFLIKI